MSFKPYLTTHTTSLQKYLSKNRRKSSCLFISSTENPFHLNAGKAVREVMGGDSFVSGNAPVAKLGSLSLHEPKHKDCGIKIAIGLNCMFKEHREYSSLKRDALKESLNKVAAALSHKRVLIVCSMRDVKALKAVCEVTLQASAVDIVAVPPL